MKITISIICVLFIFCLLFLSCWIKAKQKINLLKQEIGSLQKTITDFNKSQDVATETIIKIQEKIKYVKEDCYNKPISNDIIKLVRGEKK